MTSDYGLGFFQSQNHPVHLRPRANDPALGNDICINLANFSECPDNEKRSELMPVNRKYPLESILAACRDYPMRDDGCSL